MDLFFEILLFIIVAIIAFKIFNYWRKKTYVDEMQDKIKILPSVGNREILDSKHISCSGNSNLDMKYKLYKEAEKLGADALTNVRFGSQLVTSVSSERGSNSLFPFLPSGNVSSVSSSSSERWTAEALTINYKYSDEENTLLYTEDDAIKEIQDLEILKNNSMIDENEYINRKKEIKQKVINYKNFLLQKEVN